MKPFVAFLAGGLLVLGLAGCGGDASGVPDEVPVDEVPSSGALADATYQTEFAPHGTVTLTQGRFEGEVAAPGGATRLRVMLADQRAFGDLDGDGVADAAVLLVSSPGGSGTFYELAAVLNTDDGPENVATTLLGDRVKIDDLKVSNGQIVVELVAHGPGDPLCCPSNDTTRTFTLTASGQLVRSNEHANQGSKRENSSESP